MKVYELITWLMERPAGDDVKISCGECELCDIVEADAEGGGEVILFTNWEEEK